MRLTGRERERIATIARNSLLSFLYKKKSYKDKKSIQPVHRAHWRFHFLWRVVEVSKRTWYELVDCGRVLIGRVW